MNHSAGRGWEGRAEGNKGWGEVAVKHIFLNFLFHHPAPEGTVSPHAGSESPTGKAHPWERPALSGRRTGTRCCPSATRTPDALHRLARPPRRRHARAVLWPLLHTHREIGGRGPLRTRSVTTRTRPPRPADRGEAHRTVSPGRPRPRAAPGLSLVGPLPPLSGGHPGRAPERSSPPSAHARAAGPAPLP